MLRFSLRFCCLVGVFGVTYEMKPDSVMEGESVTLHTDREMRNNDQIQWRFGPENTVIAEISVTEGIVSVKDDHDERFRGKLKVDHQTGCLTVINTGSEHAGRYELQTSRMKKSFIVTVNVFGDKYHQSVSAMEGNPVSFHTDTELRNNDSIQWSFGKYLIAEVKTDSVSLKDVLKGRFRGRLKVDHKTGSLTITNTRAEHTGFYQLQTNSRRKVFMLSIYAPLAAPLILSHCPPESSRVLLLCAVLNVSGVTLSWLRGESLLASVSASDLRLSLSLPLELDHWDSNAYRCVLNSSFAERTQHLDYTRLCQNASGSMHSCDAIEAVIRLALSALVGVAAAAAVVVLVYDIRSRRAEHSRVPTSAT